MDSSETNCICGKPAGDNRYMIQCDGCHFWFHCSCLGITKRQRLPVEWFCVRCMGSLRQDFNELKQMVENFKSQTNEWKTTQENTISRLEESFKLKADELSEAQHSTAHEKLVTAISNELSDVKSHLATLNEKHGIEISSLQEKYDKEMSEKLKVISILQNDRAVLSAELSDVKSHLATLNEEHGLEISSLQEKHDKEISEKLKVISILQDERSMLNAELLKFKSNYQSKRKDHENLISFCDEQSSQPLDTQEEKKDTLNSIPIKTRKSLSLSGKKSGCLSQPCPSMDHDDLDPDVFKAPKRKVPKVDRESQK